MDDLTKILFTKEIYDSFFAAELPLAQKYVWIASANVKNMYIPIGKKYRSVLVLFEKLAQEGVNVRLICSADPSRSFDAELDKRNGLRGANFEMMICPRNHMKCAVIDGRVCYMGSANLTGAGLGAKSEKKRNFEAGIMSKDKKQIQKLSDYFDSIWMGAYCADCAFQNRCPAPIL